MKHLILSGNTAWSMYNFRGGLIRKLIEAGYKVSVIAPFDGTYTPIIESLGAPFINIRIDSKGTNPLSDLAILKQYKSIFKKVKPDFVFFYTIKPNIYGSMAARALKIPHIAITTGLGYTFLNNNIVAKIARSLYKHALKEAKEVWFLNRDDRDAFLSYKLVLPSKTFILRSEGINLDKFNKTKNQQKEASFVLISRMLWDKGVGEYVDAARLLKKKYSNTQFNLLGFMGVDNPSAISEEQMTEWTAEGVVKYLGSTNNVIPFISESSCVVLPSYREGVPITLLEASSMCKPIITTNSVGCKDVIKDEVTGYLCEIKNVSTLSNAMERIIIATPEERQKLGDAGRIKMEMEFNENIIFAIYLAKLNHYLK